ncbi:MAG: YceG family protein, partial [Bacillota bacterium]|nr:YceG family protein [Bacillota bacterium]
MENYNDYNTINIISNDIYRDVLESPEKRRGYRVDNGVLTIPVYFYRVIGIEQDSDNEYYNELYNLDLQLKKTGSIYQRFEGRLDTLVQPEVINKVNTIWNEIKADTNLRASYLAANLYGAGLLKFTNISSKDNRIKNSFERCLEIFMSTQKHPKNASIIKNFCIKVIYWFEKYGLSFFKTFNITKQNPKFLFYGDIKRDEIYFMIFLSNIGFDILYFNSFSDLDFSEIDPDNKLSVKLEFDRKISVKEFPKSEFIVTRATSAYQAEKNIESSINAENVNLFKPRQFENLGVKAISLKTTYEEILTLWKVEARYRNDFKIYNNTVYTPNIFAKINGVHKNIIKYWEDIYALVRDMGDFLYIYDKVPFSHAGVKTFDYRELMNNNGFFDKNKIKACRDYPLSFLKTSVQDNLLDKANELLQKEYFKFNIDLNIKLRIISTIFNLDKEIIMLLQR